MEMATKKTKARRASTGPEHGMISTVEAAATTEQRLPSLSLAVLNLEPAGC
ncbi:unnamed protein product [Arabis nemorensis]|uniref:Uncharacterized protein n=1 Tax=Arabis nemorensis TaxID=586526 RepID=A0A565BMK3_9BRAS|nr:unnamed protein product [Arabis nemorensis]